METIGGGAMSLPENTTVQPPAGHTGPAGPVSPVAPVSPLGPCGPEPEAGTGE